MKVVIFVIVLALMCVSCSKSSSQVPSKEQEIAKLEAQIQQLKRSSAVSATPDPNRPSKELFKRLLDEDLGKTLRSIKNENFIFPNTWPVNGYCKEDFAPLLEAGLVKELPATYYVAGTTKIPGVRFELTDYGSKFYRIDTGESRRLTQYGKQVSYGVFVYGKYRVKEIISYTEPMSGSSTAITEVKYTYDCGPDIAPWTKLEVVQNISDVLKADAQRLFEDTKVFVLTNEGWQIRQ